MNENIHIDVQEFEDESGITASSAAYAIAAACPRAAFSETVSDNV